LVEKVLQQAKLLLVYTGARQGIRSIIKFIFFQKDMNEPAVFGTNEERAFNWPEEDRPYWTLKCPDDEYENVKIKASYLHSDNNKLSDKTLCMNGVQGENGEYRHFDVHNLYGLSESIPTFEAAKRVTNTRGFVITRSTFIGSGKYGGHWTGVRTSDFQYTKRQVSHFQRGTNESRHIHLLNININKQI